jgi:hypothetical protein
MRLLLLWSGDVKDQVNLLRLETNCPPATSEHAGAIVTLLMANITQSLEDAWWKILRHSLNLVRAWYEGTKFTPANLDGVPIRSCTPADGRMAEKLLATHACGGAST